MQKRLSWKNISLTKAHGLVEFHKKESSVIDWEIQELHDARANLFILVEIPDKPQKK